MSDSFPDNRGREGVGRERRLRFRVAGVLGLLVLGGCVGPARTSDDYTRKASTSVHDVRSAVETARLGVDAAAGDRASGPYLSVLLSGAEEQASSVQSTFDSIQPPNQAADRVRDDVDGLLGQAVSVLGDVRIAARRGDTAGITGQGPALADLSRRLGELEDRLG
jgi:outer membrane murein-binding lipoprotein Lpp